MVTVALACPGVRENKISDGAFSDRLAPAPPAGTFTPPPPMEVVPLAV